MKRARASKPVWGAVVGALVLASCSSGSGAAPPVTTTTSSASTTTTTAAAGDEPIATVVAAGDIACPPARAPSPAECQMAATGALAESLHPDVLLPLGDLQYETGRAADFAASYDATWGRMKAITRPVVGNHEYAGGKAPGYFGSFGAAAHPPDGWYSFDLGPWHLIVLNSVCAAVGGCGEGSREYAWLQADLEATTSECILAAWHHPRWSSGLHHSDATYEPFWQLLAQHGADLVLSGHDHHFERFTPKQGIVQYVVGTGGRSLYPILQREEGSAAAQSRGFGVLELRLFADRYEASFEPVPGFGYTEKVMQTCR
jgi:hypothetical protein